MRVYKWILNYYINKYKLEVNDNMNRNYTDCNIGPKIDNDGNIVRWSIVGKAD